MGVGRASLAAPVGALWIAKVADLISFHNPAHKLARFDILLAS